MRHDPRAVFQDSLIALLKRTGVTALIIAALVLLSAFPLSFWHLSSVRPAFALGAIYYWAIFRPQVLSPIAVFVLGLLLDLVYGSPLGLWAVSLVAVQWLTTTQRRFLMGQPFAVIWLCFFIVCAVVFFLHWAVFSLFHFNLMSIRAPMVAILITGLVFPLIAWALNAINKSLADRPSSVA